MLDVKDCVYKIKCKDREKVYIGMTSMDMTTRIYIIIRTIWNHTRKLVQVNGSKTYR